MEKLITTLQKDNAPSGIQIEETETEVAVIITDLQLHTTVPRKPKSFAESVRRSLTSGKEGRTHQRGGLEIIDGGGGFTFAIPIHGMEKVVADAAAKGKNVRFFIPKDGLPIFLGKDAVERLDSLKRKGVL